MGGVGGWAVDWIMVMFPSDAQLTALLAKYKAKWFDKRIFKECIFDKPESKSRYKVQAQNS